MKNNMKKVLSLLLAVLMMASMSVTVFADEPTQSLANFTDDTMSDTLDLNYTVTHEDAYAELSAVKLEWEVPVLKLTKSDVRTWNTTTLEWEQEYEDSTDGDSVKFTLTNRGTYAVKANVSFTQDSGIETAGTVTVAYGEEIDDPESTETPKTKITVNGNDPIIASIVGDAHALKVEQGEMTAEAYKTAKDTYVKENCTATIKGKVTISDLANLTNTSGKLGTYTVKISDASVKHTVTVTYDTVEGDTVKLNQIKTFKVIDGDTITVNENTVTVNGETITYNGGESRTFDCWLAKSGDEENYDRYEGGIVTSDLEILAKTAE